MLGVEQLAVLVEDFDAVILAVPNQQPACESSPSYGAR
jgi:hypothetical protein